MSLKKNEPCEKIAVILFNLGGPDSLEAVPPFLFNLFTDPFIINLPNPFRYVLAKMLSYYRSKKATDIYRSLGGRTPLLQNTLEQANGLQSIFNQKEKKAQFKVFVAMRYWHPFFHDILPEILSFNPSKILFLPLYPQFSSTTTLSFYNQAKFLLQKEHCYISTQLICCYPVLSGFINAMVQIIFASKDLFFQRNTKYRLLLTAHGLPLSIIKKGDPYSFQLSLTKKALEAKIQELPFDEVVLCYQSKVGFLPWLSPSVEEELKRAAKDNVSVVVLPISFVSEHSETLVELDKEYKDLAEKLGITFYYRLNTVSGTKLYLEGLYEMAKDAVQSQERVVSPTGSRLCPRGFTFCPCAVLDNNLLE